MALWSCEPQKTNLNASRFNFEALVGRWESIDVKSHQIEEWRHSSEGRLQGKGYVLTDGDTTFIEFLTIDIADSIPVYYAQVKDQNHNSSIPFKRSIETKESIEFSNPEHDFPKKIVYRLLSDTEMQVYIEGPRNNETARITFDFIKAK